MDSSKLTQKQLDGFSIVERVCSVLSLLGCFIIIGTFCASKSFHKPINRLVFYASFGNMMTNVATLMARSYLGDTGSAGCQFQAFLIQMFMPADAFWTLAMAVNVYLTFYCKFDAQMLRRMELPYLFACYGAPFVIALTYIFVKNQSRGRMYGNATLWCWVSSDWDIWRIATFYGPVWVAILLTCFIYIRAGREIYKKHKQLHDFKYSTSHHELEPLPPMDDLRSNSKTTEVFVTTEIVNTHHPQQAMDLAALGRRTTIITAHLDGRPGPGGEAVPQPSSMAVGLPQPPAPGAGYSVTITSEQRPDSFIAASSPAYDDDSIRLPIQDETGADAQRAHTTPPTLPAVQSWPAGHATASAQAGAAAAAAVAIPAASRQPQNQRLRRRAAYEANSAAWSYTKCAILFFTAMLVTWIPSSANRVFSVVHVGDVSVPLEYMSAFVLPLQGFWNAIIYVVTSWKACQSLYDDAVGRLRSRQARATSSSGSSRGQRAGRVDRHPSHRTGIYERQSSAGGAPYGSNETPAGTGGHPGALRTTPSSMMGRSAASGSVFHRTNPSGGGGGGGGRDDSGSSNDSDEMLDQMVGGRGGRARSEKSYRTDSVTELAL